MPILTFSYKVLSLFSATSVYGRIWHIGLIGVSVLLGVHGGTACGLIGKLRQGKASYGKASYGKASYGKARQATAIIGQ